MTGSIGEYQIPDNNSKSEWESHTQARKNQYDAVLKQFLEIAGYLFDANGNPVLDADGNQMRDPKADPNAAGAAILFFVTVLGQELMDKQGDKIAEEADKIAYAEGYLKAVTHLKQVFSAAENATGAEKTRLTTLFNNELNNFLESLNGGGGGKRGPVAPRSVQNSNGTVTWTFETAVRDTRSYESLVSQMSADPRLKDYKISGFHYSDTDPSQKVINIQDLKPDDLQYVMDTYGSYMKQEVIQAKEPTPPLFNPHDGGDTSEVVFYCKDEAAATAFKDEFLKIHPEMRGKGKIMIYEGGYVNIRGLSKSEVDSIAKDSNFNQFFTQTDKQADLTLSWFDESTVDTLTNAINDMQAGLEGKTLTDIWAASKADGGKDPTGGPLKKFMNAFDTMGTTLSSFSQTLQGSIQYDQAEFSKFLEMVHSMGAEVNKLLESINRKSAK